ncbi:MAG TPA: hypothetical protein VGE34_02235 [Candidatus Saccharimonadales bacterium]
MSNICTELVTQAIEEALATGEPLRQEEGASVLGDKFEDRLLAIVEAADLSVSYRVIVEATAWDDAYAPLETDPKAMLRKLAYACLVAEAKCQVANLVS